MTQPAAAPEAPLPTFDELPLSPETRAALAEMGWTNPTPVQRAVFEPAARGADLVVQARTGTGKTGAFGLPIIETLVRRNLREPQVLILSPTRELALQITGELERLGSRRGVHPVAVYGGAAMGKQIDAIASGAQVIVGTPGRVLDHLTRGTLDPKSIRLLVLDEADEMLSMGFERELHAILDKLPKTRQTLLFSATVPPDIDRMAREKLKQPEFVTLSGDHVGALSIQHFVYLVPGNKVDSLVKIIEVENPESAVVFCNTKAATEEVAEALQKQGFDADWLNGDLPQGDREEVMGRTRSGKLRFLVATDVAARGIDISHLTHVINFDFPEAAERYVHRTGRTGRAGRTGTAISLVAPGDVGNLYLLRLTYRIRPIEKQLPSATELKTRGEADLVSMLADAFLARPVHPDDVSLARRLLTHDAAERILAGLLRDHLGARPDAPEEAAAARRATRPVIEPTRERPRRGRDRDRDRRDEPREERPRREAETREAETREAETREGLDRAAVEPTLEAATTERAPVGRGERAERAPSQRSERADRGERALTEAEAPRPARADEPRGERRVKVRRETRAPKQPGESADVGAAPIATFVTWEPPAEPNDDEPILTPADETSGPSLDMIELFVSVGRRDGAHPSDLQRVLTEDAGIPREETGRIRLRDRHSFIHVRREHAERAIAALSGSIAFGKTVQAEVARARGAGASSPVDG